MSDFEIIDAHVHLWRDLAREKQAHPELGRRDHDRWGNADAIGAYMDRERVSAVVSLNFYPTAIVRRGLLAKVPAGLPPRELEETKERIERELVAGVKRQNAWLCGVSEADRRVVAGVGVQKLLTPQGMVDEVEAGAARGARAVKIVPGWFQELPNDRAFWPMYRRCAELGLPVTADTGSLGSGTHQSRSGEHHDLCYGQPVNFTEVLSEFPKLTLVMAHFGSAFWDERVELARRFPNLMFDISGGFDAPHVDARDGSRALAEEDAVRVMRKVGIERMMFGSDGPHVMMQPYLEQFLRLGLTDAERRLVLSENARRIYRLGGVG